VNVERREDRELCADLVRVTWKNTDGLQQAEWAILEDISSSGACFEIEEAIPNDTIVALQFASDRLEARVKYCNPENAKYLLGVQFEQGYRWSRRRFKPQHLIQFRLRKVGKNR
jgi:hypothetical protein